MSWSCASDHYKLQFFYSCLLRFSFFTVSPQVLNRKVRTGVVTLSHPISWVPIKMQFFFAIPFWLCFWSQETEQTRSSCAARLRLGRSRLCWSVNLSSKGRWLTQPFGGVGLLVKGRSTRFLGCALQPRLLPTTNKTQDQPMQRG